MDLPKNKELPGLKYLTNTYFIDTDCEQLRRQNILSKCDAKLQQKDYSILSLDKDLYQSCDYDDFEEFLKDVIAGNHNFVLKRALLEISRKPNKVEFKHPIYKCIQAQLKANNIKYTTFLIDELPELRLICELNLQDLIILAAQNDSFPIVSSILHIMISANMSELISKVLKNSDISNCLTKHKYDSFFLEAIKQDKTDILEVLRKHFQNPMYFLELNDANLIFQKSFSYALAYNFASNISSDMNKKMMSNFSLKGCGALYPNYTGTKITIDNYQLAICDSLKRAGLDNTNQAYDILFYSRQSDKAVRREISYCMTWHEYPEDIQKVLISSILSTRVVQLAYGLRKNREYKYIFGPKSDIGVEYIEANPHVKWMYLQCLVRLNYELTKS